ncbi:MAB_1171c family putative transporter [Streptomyces californicus]|uniref:MAB_1171c family putative transporter n=1 Tax=Streptomyces californicus TaxID=67351 RepID=UPI0035D79F61
MNTVKTLCFVVAALFSYAALAYRSLQLRRGRHDGSRRVLVVTLVLQCLTFSMGIVATVSDSFLGVPNLAVLVMHVSAVAFCVGAQIILLRWATEEREARRGARRWMATGLALCTLLTGLFLLADGPDRPASDFNTGSGHPSVLVYLLVFIASQTVPCVTILRQFRIYARSTPRAQVRQALRLLSAAAAILFLYCAARAVNVLTSACGIDIGAWQGAASVLSAAGIVVLSLGLTTPAWEGAAAGAVQWRSRYRAHRTLYPLWRDLYESFPGIALEPPRSASVLHLRYRLHRRTVEIRDGRRALRPYTGPAGEDAAGAEAGDEERQALAEATRIRRALHARRAGARPHDSRDAGDFGHPDTVSFAAEVAWLTKVASAYRELVRSEERPTG